MSRRNEIHLLHPSIRDEVTRLQAYLTKGFFSGATLTDFRIFETYRSPEDQELVYKRGTSKARAWESAHQWGLAVDFVPYPNNSWSWDEHHDWNYLKQAAIFHGLDVPIVWDKPHVQSRDFEYAKRRLKGLR